MKNLTRRTFLATMATGAAATVGVGLEAVVFEPKRLSITRHRIGEPTRANQRPIRFVQLTDLHLDRVNDFHERIGEAVAELSPDFVVLTGDTIDQGRRLEPLPAFIRALDPQVQVYSILGNWERWSGVAMRVLMREYEAQSIDLLINRTTTVDTPGGRLNLVGVDDWVSGDPDVDRALESADSEAEGLLLSHCPGYRDRLDPEHSSHLRAMLSGHTHGGQIQLFGWAPRTPRGSGRYLDGWYRTADDDGAVDLYVSRGLGTSLVPVRLGSVPEIASFEWFPEETSEV